MLLTRFLLILACLSFAACWDSGHSQTDFVMRSVEVGGKTYNYRIYVPANRKTLKTPVMLYLHGSGSRGTDNRAQVDGFGSAMAPVKDRIDFIVVLPQCREETFWTSTEMSSYALAALDATVREFNGDEQQLYLAGFSLGGYGTWQIAAAKPGKFAALIPVAGGIVGERPIEPRDRQVMVPEVLQMLDSPEPYRTFAAAIGQTPVWVFHGSTDDSVPVDFSRKMVQALTDAGSANVKYTEFPNEGHLIFGKSLREPELFDWLASQRLRE